MQKDAVTSFGHGLGDSETWVRALLYVSIDAFRLPPAVGRYQLLGDLGVCRCRGPSGAKGMQAVARRVADRARQWDPQMLQEGPVRCELALGTWGRKNVSCVAEACDF